MRKRNRAITSQTMLSVQVANSGCEWLEDRTLLSNLAITDAWLVDGTGAKITNPILGQQLELRASYTTQGLSASATYSIRVIVNGIPADRTNVNFGAGVASGTWTAGIFHGYAEAGLQNVQVVLDSQNQIVEDNENDNSFTFSTTPVPAMNLPQRFGNIVTGTAGVDWRITNFADLDPRPGVLRDFKGGMFTYDLISGGHDSIDLGTGNFASTDIGVGIYAAAGGIVAAIHDGEYDRNTGFVDPAPTANYVIVDLGNGWQTRYWHLRRDSVSVKVGDTIAAGDFLGWMGSSGFSTGPHVHFEVQYKNHSVETMLDPTTFWITPPAYPADYRHAIVSGLSTQSPTASEWNERPDDIRVFTPGSRVYFWVIAGAMLPGDIRTIRYLRPDGSTFFEQDYNQGTIFFTASQWSYFVTLPSNAPLGKWTTSWLQNGVELARKSFTVASTGTPEIRVEQATQYIRSDRFTPIDFGTVTTNVSAPTQTFTITNQGSAPLTLGTVALPSGFQLASPPAATVAPGQSTTLVVRLLTSTAGYFAGQLRLATNDADTPEFRIWLEGTVASSGVGTLIPGFSVRSAPEGSRFYSNVRRTGSTSNAVTVTLSTDATELQVPATVTIPAGSSFVNFEVQAVQDLATDGDQRIQLTASAPAYSLGINELLVTDVFVGQIIVTETNGSTTVTEGGTTDQVMVSLSAQPTANVVIKIVSDDVNEVTAQPASLTFTTSNWTVPQAVTITAVDDPLIDGARSTVVRLFVDPALSDSAYLQAPAQMISVTSLDNDVAGFEIQQSGDSTITREQDFSDTVQIRLTAKPVSNVVLRITNPNPAELHVSETTLTFTPQQWNAWKSIMFTAVPDGIVDGDQSTDVNVSVVPASSDPAFGSIPDQIILVITEDLRPGFQVTETDGQTRVRENGMTDSVAIRLNAPPASPVIIRAQLAVDAEIELDNYEWTFDPSNWNIPQQALISAINDLIEEDDETFVITFTVDVGASDTAFQSSTSKSVSVIVEDDEPRPPQIQGPRTATLGSPYALTWTSIAGATSYELWVNFNSGGVNQIVHTYTSAATYDFSGFAEMGTYRAWVRASVDTGFVTRWSLWHDVYVAAPIALLPTPRYMNSASPVLEWNAVPTAVRYDIWVDNVRQGISQLIRKTDITTNSFAIPNVLPMGLYRVWVRAIDARGQSTAWSARNEFFITPRPTTKTSTISTLDRTPLLQWLPVEGARSYEIWVRNSLSGVNTHRVSNIRLPEWRFPAALNDGPYQWWVRAFGDFGVTGLWSYGRDLYVGGRPTLQAPVVNSARQVTFSWTAVQGAVTYQLQVDRLDVLQVRAVREDSLTAPTWQTPAALAAGTYRAWVRAVSSSGELSNWSRSLDFVVVANQSVEPLNWNSLDVLSNRTESFVGFQSQHDSTCQHSSQSRRSGDFQNSRENDGAREETIPARPQSMPLDRDGQEDTVIADHEILDFWSQPYEIADIG